MSRPKGFAAVATLARRAKNKRGGQVAVRQDFDRSAADSMALWLDHYLQSLAPGITLKARSSIETTP